MTPTGVEHFAVPYVLAALVIVNRSLTPTGVEHTSGTSKAPPPFA